MLATTDDAHTFGPTEYTVRDIVLRIGAKAVETALDEREREGTTGRAAPAPGCHEAARFQRWRARPVGPSSAASG